LGEGLTTPHRNKKAARYETLHKVLRKIFGPKREEVTGGWRRLHNEERHNLNASPNIIKAFKSRMMRWAWHVASMGATRIAYKMLVGKPEWRRPLGTTRRR
jgi:hypothetical protein